MTETLAPAERLAFVLHDICSPCPSARSPRSVVDAYLAASREGDFDALVAVLDPDVVLRADTGTGALPAGASRQVHGAWAVAEQALMFQRLARFSRRPW